LIFTLPLYTLAKLLMLVIVYKGKLRPAIVLVRVQLSAKTRPPRGNWKDICASALQKLERCVYLDKDLVLPPLAALGARETYFVVASTVLEGAAIMMNRIREQLELCPDLKANAVLTISAQPVDLSGVDAN